MFDPPRDSDYLLTGFPPERLSPQSDITKSNCRIFSVLKLYLFNLSCIYSSVHITSKVREFCLRYSEKGKPPFCQGMSQDLPARSFMRLVRTGVIELSCSGGVILQSVI